MDDVVRGSGRSGGPDGDGARDAGKSGVDHLSSKRQRRLSTRGQARVFDSRRRRTEPGTEVEAECVEGWDGEVTHNCIYQT